MSKYLQTAVGLFLSALLVACGGGGRGGSVPDSNPEPVNPEPVNPAGPTVANPSTGCSAASGILTDSGTYTMSFNGIERTFRLHVPQGYNTTSASPMALVFHGWGGNEDEFLGDTTVTGEADQRGYILVAPRGIGSGSPDNSYNSWSFSGSTTGLDGDGGSGVESAICDYEKTDDYNYPSCAGIAENSCAWTQCQQDDVAFTVELIDHINSRMCVDTDNIYASGGSNGGMFTWELGQNPVTAPLLRAIAPIIGLPHRGYLAPKGKNEDMPALLITGINDATVPPGEWEDESFTTTSDGDFFFYSGANAIMKSWAQAHSCDVLNPARVFATSYAETDCRTYCSADPGWPRVLDCRSDMGHTYDFGWTWPLVMDFFDQHAM